MKITVIIPAYNYLEGVRHLVDWYTKTLPKHVSDYQIIVYNDCSDEKHITDFNEISKTQKVIIIHGKPSNHGNLQIPYAVAAHSALSNSHDAVLISETDALPTEDTFSKMLQVFQNPYKKPLASVSAMYTWQGNFCYPTHKHWFQDGDQMKHDGKHTYLNGIGIVRCVGQPGVPFLFSLWKPEILKYVKSNSFRKMVGLDSDFGKFCHENGYVHLRLTQCSIEHTNGGRKSWSTPITGKKMNTPIVTVNNTQNLNTAEFLHTIVSKEDYHKPVAVLLHLFYVDLLEEMLGYLSNIDVPFDLYVNLVEGSNNWKVLSKVKGTILSKYPSATVLISENKGLDIGGTMFMISEMLKTKKRYKCILKIHSKKSIRTRARQIKNGGEIWRKELINPICGNQRKTSDIIKVMEKDNNIGMIGAAKWLIDVSKNPQLAMITNGAHIDHYVKKFKFSVDKKSVKFIGGTMFWISGDILYDFFSKNDPEELITEMESGSFTDAQSGTKTHAFERVFGLIVLNYGKKILGV